VTDRGLTHKESDWPTVRYHLGRSRRKPRVAPQARPRRAPRPAAPAVPSADLRRAGDVYATIIAWKRKAQMLDRLVADLHLSDNDLQPYKED
jgi:hypothetical protein